MAFSLVASVAVAGNGTGTATTASIDTTGADLLIITLSDYGVTSITPPTDSKGNTWIQAGPAYNGPGDTDRAVTFYAKNPTVGTGHTFSHVGGYATVFVQAWSGAHLTNPLIQNQGLPGGANALTIAPGSTTPTQDNCLIHLGIAPWNENVSSVDSGFTLLNTTSYVPGVSFAAGDAYKVQTTAAAVNPAVTLAAGTYAAVCMTVWRPAVANSPLLSGAIVGYWKMDETGTGTRADATGNGLTLTNNNGATDATGKLNNGTDFEFASNQYLSRASESLLETGDIRFHLSFWMKMESFADSYMNVLSKDDQTTTPREWAFYVQNNGNVLIEFGGGTVLYAATGLTTGVWYHVVFWHDPAADKFGLVIDNGTPYLANVAGINAAGGCSFRIGRSFSWPFDGIVDEVSFGKFVPNSVDIGLYYGSGTPPSYETLLNAGGGGGGSSALLFTLQTNGVFVGELH